MIELFCSDVHFPYQDKQAWELFLSLAEEIKPDVVHLGGDIQDFYQVTSFVTDPSMRMGFQDEFDCTFKELSRLRKITPNAQWEYKEGNHELRLQKYLFTKAAELSGLRNLALPELLRLKELECKFIPNHQKHKRGHLHHLHGNEERVGGTYPARTMYLRLQANVIFGHHHRIDRFVHRNLGGESRGAWANGCLCLLTPDYMFHPQWNQGFSIIEYSHSGLFNVQQVEFFRHKGDLIAIFNGRLVKAGAGKSKLVPLPRMSSAA